ncbi:MAG: YCF48-related protein [Bacteroidota bacterium]|nr:YCF48-related protein [Bacteroidota bacterium]
MMKSVLRLAFLLCAAAPVLTAQPQWMVVPQDPTTIMWYGVSFTDEQHGTVVGTEGNVWTTFDGCSTWSKSNFGATYSVMRVHYLNATTGYAAGQNGILRKTTDGGLTWTPLNTGSSQTFFDVYFHDENNGIVVGQAATAMITTNGGALWTPVTTQFMSNNVYSISFPTSSVGYIVGNAGKISKTTNGGSTWFSQNSGTSKTLFGVSFGSATVGAAVGTDGTILYTTNGGTSWNPATVNSPVSTVVFRAVQFVDASEAYCVGWGGYLLRSTNGGKDWTVQSIPSMGNLEALHFTSKTFGYAVGWDGLILRTKKPGELSAPTLLQPADASMNVPISGTLSWSAVGGALSYRVQISKVPDFSSTVVDEQGITMTSYPYSGLEYSTQYYWRVQGSNAQGAGPWSSIWSFTTIGQVPQAPRLLSPQNDTTRVPLSRNMLWENVAGALTYTVQVTTDSSFTTVLYDVPNLGETRYTVSGLVPSTRYFWRVSATNVYGTGPWSEVWHFTTVGTAPQAPTLLSPTDEATNIPVNGTVRWAEAPGAESYHVQISTLPSFSTLVAEKSGITALEYAYSGLAEGTLHYWRVRATNIDGTGPWSSVWKFTTAGGALAAPILVSPANGATGVSPSGTLRWNAVAGALSYHVQIAAADDFTTLVRDTSGVLTASLAYAGLQGGNTYFWRVRAVNAQGAGPWSAVWNFTIASSTLAAPVLLSPADDSTDLPIAGMLRWKSVSGAVSYHVQLALAEDFSRLVLDTAGVRATLLTYSGLLHGTEYYWRVRAVDALGPGPWSDTWNFTTTIYTMPAPILLAPANDRIGLPLKGTLHWRSVAGAETYSVQMSTARDFSLLVLDTADIADTTAAYSVTERETRYWWRVRAVSAGGMSPWSTAWSFVTELIAPPAPPLFNPPNDASDVELSGRFIWGSTTHTTSYQLQLARDPDFATMVMDTSGIPGTQKAYAGLQRDTLWYYWHVRAFNDTLAGPWSETWKFRTQKPPATSMETPSATALGLALWPNPATGPDLTVLVRSGARRVTVDVLNVLGARVGRLEGNGSTDGVLRWTWHTEGVPNGLYIVRATDGTATIAQKLIVRK